VEGVRISTASDVTSNIRTHELRLFTETLKSGLCHWILSPAPLVDPFWRKMALTKLGNPSNVRK